jgi:penicillin-binding protein 1A
LGLGIALVLAGAMLLGTLWYFGRDLPDVDSLRHYHPPQLTRIVDRDGAVIGESWEERTQYSSSERRRGGTSMT